MFLFLHSLVPIARLSSSDSPFVSLDSKDPWPIICRGKLLVVPTENIPCSAATVLYLRGKIGALVDGAAEVDKSVLLLIALVGRLDLKSDRFHPPRPKHTVSVSSSDTVSPDASHPSTTTAIILATL